MAEFSNEEYLRALADNGDSEAAKEYEQALDNRIFQLQISLAQTSDPQGRREVQKLLEQEEKKKTGLLSRKRGKSCERNLDVVKMKLQREEKFRVLTNSKILKSLDG